MNQAAERGLGAYVEVPMTVPAADRDLAATLTLPAGTGPFPAAVLVGCSGPIDRDSNAPRMPLGVMRDVAHALAGQGVASLRYDKRGVGGSSRRRDGSAGDWREVGLFDNADDVVAAQTALAARPEADADRLLLVGHSEGAVLVAHVAAARTAQAPRPAGVVLLSPPAQRGDAVLRWQAKVIEPTLPRAVRAVLRVLRVDVVAKVTANHERLRRTTTDTARIGGGRINARWFRECLDHDPRGDLARLDMPVLAVTGSADLQVDPADLAEIERIVPGAVTTWTAPGLSHVLRRAQGVGALRDYKRQIREPVDAELLDRVATWAADVTRA
jgi:pimeloyl-ACP methyl ester carboxylesterase